SYFSLVPAASRRRLYVTPVKFLANTSQLIGLPPCWCKQPQRPLQIPERMDYEESQDVKATRTGSFSVRILKRPGSEDPGALSVSHCKPGCVCSFDMMKCMRVVGSVFPAETR
ncbi:hypothetical protein KUCAC02_016399, partial [Chaenocephalus aceratus]